MPELTYATLREQVAALQEKKISSAELIEQSIDRIERFDGRLNAVVVRDFERARAAAKEADAALMRGDRRPLLGVPVTVKEAFNVVGLPTTWGLPASKDYQPTEDAVLVARLKAAGAIIIGKTNVPLRLIDWQSYNDVYGTTNNPWDVSRTPGGSSGGAAAALAAGYVALEIGSDMAGSLRIPANFCGVFAHKPTYALLPNRGHTPPDVPALPFQVDLLAVGPMARSATDLKQALDLLAGPDGAEATAYQLALPPPRADRLADFRVLVIDTHPLIPTSGALGAALGNLAQGLDKAGAKVARQSTLLPDLALIARTYMTLVTALGGADVPPEIYSNVQTIMAGIPPQIDTLDVLRGRGLVASHRDWVKADRIRASIAAQWRRLFQEFDAVLCPSISTLAFKHDHAPDQRSRTIDIDGAKYPYHDQTMVWAATATLNGLPATAMPIGSSEGLPVGMQIIGPYLEDRTPLRLAELIEQQFGGFKPPPGFE